MREWRKSVRVGAKEAIPTALAIRGPLGVSELYEMMLETQPEMCDESIPCEHNGKRYGDLEWKHQVRWALEDLKRHGEVRRLESIGWEAAR